MNNQRQLNSIAVPQTRAYKASPVIKPDKLKAVAENIGKLVLDMANKEQDDKELSVIEEAEIKIEDKMKDNVVDQSEIQEIKIILQNMKQEIKRLKKERKGCCC